MKKVVSLLMVMAIFVTALVGCGSSANPEDTAKKFFADFKAGKFENLTEYAVDDAKDDVEGFSEMFDQIADGFTSSMPGVDIDEDLIESLIDVMLNSVEFEITDTEVAEDEATVEFTLIMPDFEQIGDTDFIMEAAGMTSEQDMIDKMLEISGKTMEELELATQDEITEISNKFVESMLKDIVDYLDKNIDTLDTTEEEGSLEFVNKDGEWLISKLD